MKLPRPAAGRADPSILDDFYRQSMEQAYAASSEGSVAPDFEAAAQAVRSHAYSWHLPGDSNTPSTCGGCFLALDVPAWNASRQASSTPEWPTTPATACFLELLATPDTACLLELLGISS